MPSPSILAQEEEEAMYAASQDAGNFLYVVGCNHNETYELSRVLQKYAYRTVVDIPGNPRIVADERCVGVVIHPLHLRDSKVKKVIAVAQALEIAVHVGVMFDEDSKAITLIRMVDGD